MSDTIEAVSMTNYDEVGNDLVHLGRLAMSGREQDVELYLRRLARRLRTTHPETASALIALLRESPTRSSPLRTTNARSLPVDMDSRLPLLRLIELDRVEPILEPGLERVLGEIVEERAHRGRLFDAGLSPSRAALFVGPPGVGKTMAAGWVARQLGVPLAVLDLSSVMSSLLGKTGINLRNAFDYAKESECVLLLDELDAIGKRRADDSDVGELKRLVTVLLQQIDDWPDGGGLILAATNHPDLLDPAVWRRFDRAVTFDYPSHARRVAAVHRFAAGTVSDWLAELIAAETAGASYSDIEHQVLVLRRSAAIRGDNIESVVLANLSDTRSKPREDRVRIARSLITAGLSQRRISQLTGISRDTLRRHCHDLEGSNDA